MALYHDAQSFSMSGSLETRQQLSAGCVHFNFFSFTEVKARYFDPKLKGGYFLGDLKTHSLKWDPGYSFYNPSDL